jgi:acyl-CoA synthetase (NDP forming)
VLREAGRRGVRCAVVLSRSPATAGPGPRRAELLRIAREHGIRLVGPNSLGVVNTDPLVLLDAGLAPIRPPAGGLAMAAQSGAVGIALLEHAARDGCGIASFVSLGDQLEVSANDLIGHWHTDPRVRAIALYLDSYGDTTTFARLARAVTPRKPVLAVCGAEAATARDALFTRTGVIRVAGIDEMTDAARMFVDQPLPAGRRLGIVGNAGGLVALAAQSARTNGFTVPGRVVDAGVDASPRRVAEAVESVVRGGGLDALLLVIAGTRANVPDAITAAVAAVVDPCPRLTTAAVLTGCADDIHHLGTRRTPVYRQPDRAVRALAHARRYATWRLEPARTLDPPGSGSWAQARDVPIGQARRQGHRARWVS